MLLFSLRKRRNIVLVFHRILDLKAGLNIYSDPFLFLLLITFSQEENYPSIHDEIKFLY